MHFLDKMLILEFLSGLGILFTTETSNEVDTMVKMRGYSSFFNTWFESHGFPAISTPFLDKTFILGISVGFRGTVYNRD